MEIKASMVKELRERTGAGMMECKKVLVDADGDIEKAIELLRTQGQVKAEKKSGRIAAEGLVIQKISTDAKKVAMVEINCETDFVTKQNDFIEYSEHVAQFVLEKELTHIDQLMQSRYPDPNTIEMSFEDKRKTLISKIGENIAVRRIILVKTEVKVAAYLHGVRIGVIVEYEGGDETLGKDIAMHVAASRPLCLSQEQVSVELIAKEKEIYIAQAQDSGKAPEIIEKMVAGKLSKFIAEITLLGQPFVKEPDLTIEKLLQKKKAKVKQFIRFEVGEGIEKKSQNFAEEVMAQVRGS